jgi:hypothetical protein
MAAIQVPPDSTGKLVDSTSLDDGGVAVYRQKVNITGASGTAEVVATSMSAPAASAVGLVVRQAGTATIAGTVNVNGGVAISGTATVAGSVVISGTATIAGSVVISGTAVVAGNVNISATAVVAGSLNVSGSVVVSGTMNIFAMGDVPSASRGPRTVIASTSANATLIAAPGANLCIYVTSLAITNASGSNARARIGPSASTGQVTIMMAQSGGGAVMNFVPPWQVSANEALLCSVKPNVSEGIFVAHFFVASADVA